MKGVRRIKVVFVGMLAGIILSLAAPAMARPSLVPSAPSEDCQNHRFLGYTCRLVHNTVNDVTAPEGG